MCVASNVPVARASVMALACNESLWKALPCALESHRTYSAFEITRVYILQFASVDDVSLIDVRDEFGECTSIVRSGASASASDARRGVGSIELITVPNGKCSCNLGICG